MTSSSTTTSFRGEPPSFRPWVWGFRISPHGRRGNQMSECVPPSVGPAHSFLFLCRFNPDRFAPHTSHARRGLEFCPFGTPSRRKCPGYIFSHFETTVILSILLHRFQVVLVPNQVVERDYGLVTMPKNELYISIKER